MCTSIHAKIQNSAKNRKFLVVPAVPGIPVVPFRIPRFRRCLNKLSENSKNSVLFYVFLIAFFAIINLHGVSTKLMDGGRELEEVLETKLIKVINIHHANLQETSCS